MSGPAWVDAPDGARFATWTSGALSDHLPVVLLHGGPGMWDYLEPVAGLISDLTVVHRYDQRGCGSSTDPTGADAQTIARSLDDLELLRRRWGHERWIVVGHSFGATLALEYAAAYPDRVAAGVYLSGVGIGDWRSPFMAERARRMSPAQQDRLAELEDLVDLTEDERIELMTLSWCTDYADPAAGLVHARRMALAAGPVNWRVNRVLMAETRTWTEDEVRARAVAVTTPFTFLHGELDTRPFSAARVLADVMPASRFELIDGAGHLPWVERPDAVGGVLRQLILATPR